MSKTQHASTTSLVGITMALIFIFTATAPLYGESGGGLTADGLGTVVTPAGSNTFDITGGTIAGNNLFHSFSEFNVENSETANFVGNQNLTNIFVRVTEDNNSWVDGTIKTTDTNANVYIMNPNGVVFGPNASFDMNGSSHVSTADYMDCNPGETDRFYANGRNDNVFDLALRAFGFEDSDVGPISVDGANPSPNPWLPEGKTFSAIGGDIELKNGAVISISQGRINLAAVKSEGEVIPTESGLDASSCDTKGDVTITDTLPLSVSGPGAGSIFIVAGQFVVRDESIIRANTSLDQQGGLVVIHAEDISFEKGSRISAETTSSSTKNGASVTLNAEETVAFSGIGDTSDNSSGISAFTDGEGDGGNVTINAKNITFKDGAEVNRETTSTGDGGDVIFNAEERVEFSGTNSLLENTSGVTLRTSINASGSSGILVINARDIAFLDGGRVEAYTEGGVNGGNVTLNATGDVEFSGTIPFPPDAGAVDLYTTSTASGSGGNLIVDAANITVKEGSKIKAYTEGTGQGGNVTLMASDSVNLSGGGEINAYTEGTGDAGAIVMEGAVIDLDNAIIMSASTSTAADSGETGTVTLTANTIALKNSEVSTSTAGGGNAGAITMTAEEISLEEGAKVVSGTDGSGKSGDVDLTASTSIVASDSSHIDVGTNSEGDGGDVYLQAPDIRFEGGAQIKSLTDGAGKGGNVLVEGENIIFDASGGIVARACDTGDGGGVTVLAEETFRLTGGQPFYVDSYLGSTGLGGNLQVEAKDIIIEGGAQVEVKTHGPGHGGTATFRADDTMDILGGSSLFTSTAGTGDGGSIQLQGGEIRIEGSEIKTESTSAALDAGDAGDILVEADDLITLDAGSSISSTAAGGGDAGDVTVNVNDGATLQGTGNIMGTVIVNAGATLAPGETAGILSTGNLTFNVGATYFVELDGTTVGDKYDQVDVTGAVDLGGAALDVAAGFIPIHGQTFTILNNDGADPLVNTFNGLDEGDLFNRRGSRFRITYRGGDGNDVVLTYLRHLVPYMLLLETRSRHR